MFRYSKNYGSLTHETRIKDVVNMKDLIFFWRPFVPLRPKITALRCNFLALISMNLNFSFSITLVKSMRSHVMPKIS